MRIWLHSSVKAGAIAKSTAFSLVTHAVLVSAAVYSTGVRAREVELAMARHIFYLPPPDRRPASDHIAEHVQYVDIGAPVAFPSLHTDARDAARASSPPGQERVGKEADSQSPATAFDSRDSVYSVLDVEESAVRTDGSAAPVYPPELLKLGLEGGVFIRFVVDTNGHADPQSIEILGSTHPLFTESVRYAVPLMLFSPAAVGGKRVRQAAEQNFQFRITPATPAEHTRTRPVP